jgi:very-short-patch-repair endonuclease/DNA polymerase III delta prime subunit
MPGHGLTLVEQRLEEFRKNLLDTSLRNRLINFRTRTIAGKPFDKIVEVHGEDSADLYRILVTEGKAMSFIGKPDRGGQRAGSSGEPSEEELPYHEDDRQIEGSVHGASVDKTDLKLNTHDTVSALHRKLTKLYREAKLAVEEQGVNVLFLAMGALRWYESDASEEERRAPLILIPVSLERTSAGSFRIKWDGSEVGENLSIAAKIRGELGIRLPELTEDVSFEDYFVQVADAIHRQARWSIDPHSVVLGFFSYAKFLMYRDLDASSWPESDKPKDHPTISALLDGGFSENESGIGEDEFLDPLRPASDACEVYDADGSQTLAILEAKSGRSMVIEGPPGTGKSQTITNLIAELVGSGKKVLFIAEKAAALDVVHRRLCEANLDDACLELHSNKANKRSFYAALKHTVSVAAPKLADIQEQIRKLEEAKTTLNAYVEAVNLPMDRRSISPRSAMGRLIELGREPSPEGRHDFTKMDHWSGTDFKRRCEVIQRLKEQVAKMGRPVDHPYFGCTLDHLLPADKEDIARHLQDAEVAVESFHISANALAEALRVELPVKPVDVEKLRDWANFVAHSPEVTGIDIRWLARTECDTALREVTAIGKSLFEIDSQLSTRVPLEQLGRDVSELRRLLRLSGLGADSFPDRPTADMTSMHKALDAAAAASFAAFDASKPVARELGIAAPQSLGEIETISAIAKRVGAGPDVSGVLVSEPSWTTSAQVVEEAISAIRKYRELRGRYGAVIADAGWSADVGSDLDIIEKQGGSLFRIFNSGFKSAMANSGSFLIKPANRPQERILILRAIIESREAERCVAVHLGRCSSLFGERWRGVHSDPNALTEISSWVQELHLAVASKKLPPEALVSLERGLDRNAMGEAGDELRRKADASSKALQEFKNQMAFAGILTHQTNSQSSDFILVWILRILRPALAELKKVIIGAESVGFGGCLLILDEVQKRQELKRTIESAEEAAKPMGPYWQGATTDWARFEAVLDWVRNLHRSVREGKLPEGLVDFFAEDRPRSNLNEAVSSAQRLRLRAQEAVRQVLTRAQLHDDPNAFTEEPIATQRNKISNWKSTIEDLPSMIRYNSIKFEADRLGLHESIELAEDWGDAGSRLLEAFERSWYTGLVREAITKRQALAHFERTNHEEIVAEFRHLDDLMLKYNRAKVALAHWMRVPRDSVGGAMGWLNVQFGLRQSHKPIRVSMEKAGEAVQAIKPVFLMSPLSVAMYLPAKGPRFDVVIFDEASQVKPEDSLGGLLRARQTIVVGDSKQMPPTSFFDKLTSEEVADDEESFEEPNAAPIKELESVLALMSARLPARSPRRRDLRWHYRSHHDGLIATSNRLFYEDRLVVFPSPWRSGANSGLMLRYDPTTVYDRGGKRKNILQARQVALAAKRHVIEHPKLTLGIAAFSKAQQEAIQDEIDLLRGEDPAFAAFDAEHPFEPLFVKNLENVQGDERDVIFISVGYGRDKDGFISGSFGPLNRDGGERRLNVLITRARVRCEVFTSIKAAEVKLTENAPRGVLALKTFLAFADTGSLDVPATTGMEPQSPFEEVVLDKLRAHGYDVEPQVGSCGFYIDMAVRHPEQPERFVLGIECDGAMYHRARSARDRDKLRQEVLERRGWRIHRIWSTDWFHHEEREFERLIQVLQSAINVADEERLAAEESARSSDFVELDRDDEVKHDDHVPVYQLCELQIDETGFPLHERTTGELADWVAKVVETETPVHTDEVVRRIREAAGFLRTGDRIQSAVARGIELARRQGRVRPSGHFLFSAEMTEVLVRSRASLPPQVKKLDLVSDEEITSALLRVVERSYGIEFSEAATLTARRLGFDRTTPQMVARIGALIEGTIASGSLRSESGLLKREKADAI